MAWEDIMHVIIASLSVAVILNDYMENREFDLCFAALNAVKEKIMALGYHVGRKSNRSP